MLARVGSVSPDRLQGTGTHPIDEATARFYGRFGFFEVPDATPRMMALGLGHLAAAARAV